MYLGTFENEREAAVRYDEFAIRINGLRAKTNFSYNKAQVRKFVLDDQYET